MHAAKKYLMRLIPYSSIENLREFSNDSVRLVKRCRKPESKDPIIVLVENSRRSRSDRSIRIVKRCHKPDRKEFTKVASRTAIGFVVFFVKLIFIPINNIIVGSG